jgi:serine/threonine-protein kinase
LHGDGLATPASDVYALAETALWLLSGQHPFAGLQINDLMVAKRTSALRRPIEEMLPDCAPAVHHVLGRGLAAEPADRFATAGEFAAALTLAERRSGSRRWWSWR